MSRNPILLLWVVGEFVYESLTYLGMSHICGTTQKLSADFFNIDLLNF